MPLPSTSLVPEKDLFNELELNETRLQIPKRYEPKSVRIIFFLLLKNHIIDNWFRGSRAGHVSFRFFIIF